MDIANLENHKDLSQLKGYELRNLVTNAMSKRKSDLSVLEGDNDNPNTVDELELIELIDNVVGFFSQVDLHHNDFIRGNFGEIITIIQQIDSHVNDNRYIFIKENRDILVEMLRRISIGLQKQIESLKDRVRYTKELLEELNSLVFMFGQGESIEEYSEKEP